MEGPAPAPDGWEWHWSRTFERHYLWSPTTNAVRWPSPGIEGTEGPEVSAYEPADEHGAVQEAPGPTSMDQPDTESQAEFVGDGTHATDADDGVNEYYVDYGDSRVGFPDRRPAVMPHMHGWTYPPLIELVDRLLCSGAEAMGQPGVHIIVEVTSRPLPIALLLLCLAHMAVIASAFASCYYLFQIGSWLGCSTRLLARYAPQVRTHRLISRSTLGSPAAPALNIHCGPTGDCVHS